MILRNTGVAVLRGERRRYRTRSSRRQGRTYAAHGSTKEPSHRNLSAKREMFICVACRNGYAADQEEEAGLLSEAYERLICAYHEAREINDELEELLKNTLMN